MPVREKSRQTDNAVEGKGKHTFKNIVVALDGSAEAEAIFPYVEPIARAFGSTITFVCALVPLDATIEGEMALVSANTAPGVAQSVFETQDLVAEEDASYLIGVGERWSALGFDVECREPEMRPSEAIVKIAREEGADLIAMATHGRTGMKRSVQGSVTDQVVRTAPCSVLLIGPEHIQESR